MSFTDSGACGRHGDGEPAHAGLAAGTAAWLIETIQAVGQRLGCSLRDFRAGDSLGKNHVQQVYAVQNGFCLFYSELTYSGK